MESEPRNYLNQTIFSVLKDEHEKFLSSLCESESIHGNMKIVFQDRSVIYNKLLFIILNPEAMKLIPPSDTESDLVIIYPDHISSDIFVKDNEFQSVEDDRIETNDCNFENGYKDMVDPLNLNFCFICSKSYSTKRKLQKHNYYLHPKSTAGDKIVKKRNSNSATAKDISENKCNTCGKLFKRAYNLKIHMNVHAMDPIERVQCAECTSTFSNHSSLYRHFRTVHNSQALSIKCVYCNKEFQRRDNLMRHVSKFHTK